ncbi:MAG TPA: hypothetical protein VFY99_06215 [Solirubrobacterales bacterium]
MTLQDACEKAAVLNREEEARGSAKRFVVVADPVGSWDGRYQLVPRQVEMKEERPVPAR